MYKGGLVISGTDTHSEPRPPLEGHERTRVGARVPNPRRCVSEEPCARFCVCACVRPSVRRAGVDGGRCEKGGGGGQVGRQGKGGATSSARLTCAGTT